MLTKTKAALVAVIRLGSASGRFAYEPFDVDIFRPVPGEANGRAAYAQDMHWQPRGVKPFTEGERRVFDRTSQPSD